MMNGIDIASYQTGIDLSKVPCDFVIIKATQGISYVNPDFKRAYDQAKKLGKCIGFYHYASAGGAEAEAQHFLNTIGKSRLDNGILVLDWEKGDNKNWGNVSYAKRFLDYILEKTGFTPFIYLSKSVCREYNWSSVAKIYPLWVAQYPNYTETGYKTNPWTDKLGYGAWDRPLLFQYSSVGRLAGWNGHLDLDIAYISEVEWKEYASHKTIIGAPISTTPKTGKTGRVDTSSYPLTKLGHKNEWVRLLQNALTILGYPCASDGIFGPETKKMVIAFQMNAFPDDKKEWDGVVGTKTWYTLFN